MTEPDTATFERLAREALATLPAPFAKHLEGIVVRVEDFADDETLDSMGIDDPWDLTGLYHGRPVGEPAQTGELPPVVYLYRQPLLEEIYETGVGLEELVTHVVVHEIGHHFGLSDEQMDAIERAG